MKKRIFEEDGKKYMTLFGVTMEIVPYWLMFFLGLFLTALGFALMLLFTPLEADIASGYLSVVGTLLSALSVFTAAIRSDVRALREELVRGFSMMREELTRHREVLEEILGELRERGR